MNTFEELQELVIKWAEDRKIIPNATPISQLLKTVAEVGELADAVNKRNRAETMDAVGDVLICLINFCALSSLDLNECLQGAYNEIKDRTGTLLPSGVFVKDE
jgi:NTP pyrophosphatase (non-canonical NTP hydrolase)